MAVTRERYSSVAIVLHWLIAAAIVVQILLAWRMHDLHTPLGFALTQLHKSVGITILALSLVRLAWRFVRPPPPEPAALAGWEKLLAGLVHAAFYVIMIGMPITGWIMVSASRTDIPTLLYGVVPLPHLPIAELSAAAKKPWRSFGRESHEWLAYGAYALILLHVAGALKHQLLDRNMPVLSRMAPGAQPGRPFDPRFLAIAVAGCAVVAAGWFYVPPLPASAPPPPPASTPDAALVTAPDPQPSSTSPADASTPAQTPPEATKVESKPAAPSHWKVARGSTISFATDWSGQAIEGRFDRWTADVLFDPDLLSQSKVKVTIDLASVNTGDAQRDQSLPSADWFDAAEHPKAIYAADRFEKLGEGRFMAHGKLSLRGVTRPLDLPFQLKIDGDKARVSGVTSLDRTAFGVGQGEWQATDQIPAKVKVSIQLTATR